MSTLLTFLALVTVATLLLHQSFKVCWRPCCRDCGGTGVSGDFSVPGGLCWDCRATGHPHRQARMFGGAA